MNLNQSDDMAAEENLQFILQFIQENPQYKDTDIYIASESYGGHYIPTLTKKILDQLKNNNSFNFKGFLLGNPYTNPAEQLYGQMAHFAGSSLIPTTLFHSFVDNC